MKKIAIKSLILIIIISCLINVNYKAYALDLGQADKFIEVGAEKKINVDEVGTEFTTIGNILTYIGVGILVAATGYMGILYIISPPEKQAKLKQQLIGLVVSGFVIFGAYYIWKIVVTFLETTIG